MHYFCIFICIWIEWQFHFPQCRLSCIPIQLMTTINITRTMKMVRANGNERCGKWLNYHATHFQLRKKKQTGYVGPQRKQFGGAFIEWEPSTVPDCGKIVSHGQQNHQQITFSVQPNGIWFPELGGYRSNIQFAMHSDNSCTPTAQAQALCHIFWFLILFRESWLYFHS